MDHDEVRQFIEAAARRPLLTHDEEHDLDMAAGHGDEEARKELMAANLRLVVSIARQYQMRNEKHPSLGTLLEAGGEGLMRAVEKFDTSKDVRFSTWATWWSRQGITRRIADEGPP